MRPTFVRGRDTKVQGVHRPGALLASSAAGSTEGAWIPTTCRMCLVNCQVLVKVEDGRMINVIGNPDSPKNRGRMCAKGKSGIMNHYNRNRITHPLRRTNPQKGLGVDPGWQEISWDDALDTFAAKLKAVVERNPRRLYIQTWVDADLAGWLGVLATVTGSAYHQTGVSGTCGKTIHAIQNLTAGGFWDEVDFEHCRYLLDVGTQQGIATREGFNHSVPDCANARVERGMKLVVVDPIGNNAAAKADEWLPIRPGTDAALGLAILHVLLNEAGLYDAPFLRARTNAGYLVGPDGRYVRDAEGRPQLLDTADGAAKAFDDPTLAMPALEGSFEVGGTTAKPAFQLLKERAATCTPEVAEPITTIPAARLRRIAREFGEAASIGSTIMIDGIELPYRPVALNWCRGGQGHKHAWGNTWALQLVNVVVGCINMPGGYQSRDSARTWPVPLWPEVGQDGMLMRGGTHGEHAGAFPGRPAHRPERIDIFELFPVAAHTRTLVPEVHKDPEVYGIDHAIDMLIHSAGNQVAGGWGDVRAAAAWYGSIDFVVGFAVEITETHEFDDIVLPLPTYMEENAFCFTSGYTREAVCGEAYAFHAVQQQVLDRPPKVRDQVEVMIDVYRRAGLLDDVYEAMNPLLGLKPGQRLEPGRTYSHAEVIDRWAKSLYGEEHGWEWFRENGVLVWERDVRERYPGAFVEGRIPIYMENFIDRREELAVVLGEMGLAWNLEDYDPMPKWLACAAYGQLERGEIDAIGIHYKLPFVYGGQGNQNPWIDELCEKLPHPYGALVNTRLARAKGIRDGDWIWLETPASRQRIRAHVTECVHPQVIGIAGHAGHWSGGRSLGERKGVNFNSLLPYDMDHLDTLTTAMDMCAPLRIRKA